MELKQVLRMNEGDGEMSYAKNSSFQREVISRTKSMREEAISKLYNSIFPLQGRSCVAMAELGCASGPNALLVVRELITIFNRIRHDSGHQQGWLPEFQVFLNDLLANDFNNLFRALPGFHQQLDDELGPGFGSCFVNAMPGSFYGRLFPAQSMHFFHSSSTLHWLSQMPTGIERSKNRSPASVKEAYQKQFQSDFSMFVKCRSEELVSGGCMVFTLFGRKNDKDYFQGLFRDLVELILLQMTSEGLIEGEKMDTFNPPLYLPTIAEIENEIKKEGSFKINHAEVFEVSRYVDDKVDGGGEESQERRIDSLVKCSRAVTESVLCSHFGEALPIDQVVRRYEGLVRAGMITDETKVVIAVSMTKC